jgi:hypothetical protein
MQPSDWFVNQNSHKCMNLCKDDLILNSLVRIIVPASWKKATPPATRKTTPKPG